MQKVHIRGSYFIKAPREKIYEIVTNFEKAPQLFPKVAHSMKLLERHGNSLHLLATTCTFGQTFEVDMQTMLIPSQGFTSLNTSKLAREEESFIMEEATNGTHILYRNDVEIFLPIPLFIKKILFEKLALWYWEKQYFEVLKKLVQ